MKANDISDFLDFLTDAVLIVDTDSKVVFANTAGLELFECKCDQMAELSLEDLLGVKVPNHKGMVASFIGSGSEARPMMSRTIILCKTALGRGFQARISLSTILHHGEVCGVAVIQDYTQIMNELDVIASDEYTVVDAKFSDKDGVRLCQVGLKPDSTKEERFSVSLSKSEAKLVNPKGGDTVYINLASGVRTFKVVEVQPFDDGASEHEVTIVLGKKS